MTIRLHFPDAATGTALLFVEAVSSIGTVLVPHAGMRVAVLGAIKRPTGKVLIFDGIAVPEMTAVQGWHVNVEPEADDSISADLMKEMQPYIVEPQNAYCVTA
jgi:hypothetical protein